MVKNIKGLAKQPNSNRHLAKRFKLLNRLSFGSYKEKTIIKASGLKKMPYDLHDVEVTDSNCIFRAIINDNTSPFNSINRIKYNPSPSYISRANMKGQGIAYYTCDLDISVIEACRDKLRNSSDREFYLTVSKWKIVKGVAVQIICNSQKAQSVGTDLIEFCKATNAKRRKDFKRKYYRTYSLKTRFIADQYAKDDIACEKDYIISAIHSKTLLKSEKIDGVIYPSVGYMYKGFNYAIKPSLFDNSYFQLNEVAHVKVRFDKDFTKYPKIEVLKTTSTFSGDEIVW
ncbi:MAG: hypothetical protein BGP01_03735 [Paludibacter sp. 47-17]|nr:MAG: hypothetical protein BGP01_03735 [Paludibacter sp. 47-17]